jgi:hypothetical protein
MFYVLELLEVMPCVVVVDFMEVLKGMRNVLKALIVIQVIRCDCRRVLQKRKLTSPS